MILILQKITRKNILRDEAWIKSTWNDVRKYLHQVFIQYNRSGQHSGDMGEWCSPEEQQRWVRAAFWKGGSTNSIVRYPTVMIYSIAILEQSDFEALGCQMPEGSGIDNSVAVTASEAAQGKKKRKKRGNYNKNNKNKSPDNNSLLRAIENGTRSETQLSALRMLLEFGNDTQKRAAIKEVQHLADVRSQNKRAATRVEANLASNTAPSPEAAVADDADDNSTSHTEEEDNMDSEDEE
jgi:hypothetical protein